MNTALDCGIGTNTSSGRDGKKKMGKLDSFHESYPLLLNFLMHEELVNIVVVFASSSRTAANSGVVAAANASQMRRGIIIIIVSALNARCVSWLSCPPPRVMMTPTIIIVEVVLAGRGGGCFPLLPAFSIISTTPLHFNAV